MRGCTSGLATPGSRVVPTCVACSSCWRHQHQRTTREATRPSLAVIELPTIRLEMGLQDLGRPNLTPTRAGRADSCGITLCGCSRPAGLAPPAPGGGVDAGPRRPGQGQGPPQAVPQGRHAPLTRPGRGVGSAGWPRQRPVRVRVQGPGRGVGAAGEAVPGPRSSGPARFIGTCPVVFGGPCRNALWTAAEPSRRSLGPFAR
jgi:hypothetical protein